VTTSVNSWFDVTAYGATGNGVTVDLAACQSAVTACIDAGGGTVYFPTGQYLFNGALTVNTSSVSMPIKLMGVTASGGNNVNTAGGANILLAQTASTTVANYGIYATGGGYASGGSFYMEDITFSCVTQNTVPTATYDAIYTNAIPNVNFHRIQMYEYHVGEELEIGTTTNSGIHTVGATMGVIDDCAMHCEVSCYWMDCSVAVTVQNCYFGTTNGTGFGSVRVDNWSETQGITGDLGAGTLQLCNVITGRGDWGLYVDTTGSVNVSNPGFIFVDDMQINNPNVGGMYFQGGSGVWMDYAWISILGGADGVNGILLDTAFEGTFYMNNSVIQSSAGHGMWIKGGTGHAIYGTAFGGCGHGDPNNYDDIHIAAAASNVTINGNHFDVDYANGRNGARSAIYVEDGASDVNVVGNIFDPNGYLTNTVIDIGQIVTAAGNTNWQSQWWYLTTDSGWSTVSGYAPIRVRFSPDGNLQFDGLVEYSSNLTSNTNINGSNPLPAQFRPTYNAYFPSSTGGRAAVQVQPNGVVIALGASGSTNRYAEIHEMVPLT
jgi:hypothetical protein